MKRFTFLHILTAVVISCIAVVACNDENYSLSPKLQLSFSQDTIYMDTLLTQTGSSTHILKVYNSNDANLQISSIRLAAPEHSGFRINVDGVKGKEFADIELRANDSLFIFVEATLPIQDRDEPVFLKDSLLFLTNGNLQNVKLLAYAQDFLTWKGKHITQDTTIQSARPIVIYDSLYIAENATLTIDAGTRLYFHDKSSILVHGTLITKGTIDHPVVFRGDRTDHLFTHLPYDRIPGQWGGIHLFGTSYNNQIECINLHGGLYGIRCDSSSIEQNKLVLSNSIIHQVSGNGLEMTSCKAGVINSQISNSGAYCVKLLGGIYQFVHCTLANYYSWNIKKGVALGFFNEKDEIAYPLHQAIFQNCLIAGASKDEVLGTHSENEEIPFGYQFSHCLINTILEEGQDNKQFETDSILKDDYFILMDNENQLYDFQLDSLSKAINMGAVEHAMFCPLDLKGKNRLADGMPDAGCYERAITDHENLQE